MIILLIQQVNHSYMAFIAAYDNPTFSVAKMLDYHRFFIEHRIAGNFRGVQFSRMASLQSFRGLIFADVGDRAHYTCTLCNRT